MKGLSDVVRDTKDHFLFFPSQKYYDYYVDTFID